MSNQSEVLSLASAMLRIPSIAPVDGGVQDLLQQELRASGFAVDSVSAGEVPAFFAGFGTKGPLFVFSGHTDVVPPGDTASWTADPFAATIRDRALIGRGAVDMKSGVAAMVVAAKRFVKNNPDPSFRIGFAVSGDEETDSCSMIALLDYLKRQGITIDYALVGEPTSATRFGDMVKVGRRGSFHVEIIIQGKQGHTAYPHRVINPILSFAPVLEAMRQTSWDCEHPDPAFEPTIMQPTKLLSDSGAANVVPGTLVFRANWRFRPPTTPVILERKVRDLLDRFELNYTLTPSVGALPFSSSEGEVADWVCEAIAQTLNISPQRSTSGGTSDARLIAGYGADVVEFGLLNETMHQVDERVTIEDLETLVEVYYAVLENIERRFLGS